MFLAELKFNRGAVIKEPGSTAKYHTGAWRSFRPVVDKSKCKRCGLCWSHCPDSAVIKTPEGKFAINYTYCKGCGICAKMCPFKAIEMKLEEK